MGNGLSINMWEDRWLNEEVGRNVSSKKPKGCTIQKVWALLHLKKTGWNTQLLNQIFSEKECLAINRIPVSSLGLNDRLIWHDSLTRQYSVKSG